MEVGVCDVPKGFVKVVFRHMAHAQICVWFVKFLLLPTWLPSPKNYQIISLTSEEQLGGFRDSHSKGLKKSCPIIQGQAGAHAALHMLHRLGVPLQSGRLPNCQWMRMLWEHIRSLSLSLSLWSSLSLSFSMDTHAVRAYQVWPKREREVRWRSSPTKKVTGSFGQAGGTPEFVGKVFPLLALKKVSNCFQLCSGKTPGFFLSRIDTLATLNRWHTLHWIFVEGYI